MVEMRSLKFTIAAANPLLAEKLAAPSGQLQQLHSPSSRSQLAPLIPKVEKGKKLFFDLYGYIGLDKSGIGRNLGDEIGLRPKKIINQIFFYIFIIQKTLQVERIELYVIWILYPMAQTQMLVFFY